MEEAIVGAVVGASIQVVLQNLLSISKGPISLIQFFKKDLEKLKSSFDMVHDILYDAGMQQVTDRAVKRWLRSLEEVAFDADNVLDEINYQLLSNKVEATQITAMKKVQSFFSHTTLACKIRDINKRLESSNQQAIGFGLHMRLAGARAPGPDASASMETDSFSADPFILGRENDVSRMVEMLINTSRAEQVLSVLPIVGMGGLGKTTLARKVFGNEQIISHFGDNRVWVYVSRNFDVRNILKNILTSLTTETFQLETREAILKKLQKHLGAKTYLLVLDDHWNEEREAWDGLVNSLLGISSATGNCIIVTTRSQEVASIVKTLPVYKLKGLSEDDSWSIIKAKAFINSGDIPMEFETMGRNIAERCKGLPLAAKVVGGLLRDKSKYEWLSIEKNWLSCIGDGNHISKILKLSFDHLSPPSLKKCFSYCSIFPKGYEIEKEQLIELWMAEGFLQTDHQRSNINMETTGSNFFNLLLQNSLLQVAFRFDYSTSNYNMHDLVHDLACSVLYKHDDVTEGVSKSRYIGYKPSGDGFLSIPKGQERYVRTLFFNGRVSDIKFSDFESLHTLTLVNNDIDNLPTSIKELKHLRYLDIWETRIRSLPDSIGELYHLQTFRSPKKENTRMRSSLEKLPDSLSCLISLKHLHIPDDTKLPPQIGKLTSLQTLPYFHVSVEKGCGISELGDLKDLKGKLEICNLEKVRNRNEAMSADLILKRGIDKIKLVWDGSRVGDESNDESVLEGLQPHPNLERLEIFGFKGKKFPPWTSKMAVQLDGHYWEGLDNLLAIKLTNCSECEELPMLGHLLNLKYLYLSGLTNVKSIRPSFYGIDKCGNNNKVCTNVVLFRELKTLKLVNMPNLKDWNEAGDMSMQPIDRLVGFPRLEYLEVRGCNKLLRAPSHFPCLKELIIGRMESGLPLENICGMKLTSLTHLEIQRIKELEHLPDGLLSNNHNLSKMKIYYCPKMTHLVPFLRSDGAPSLKVLKIKGCSSLRELPNDLQSLDSLERLVIEGCPDLKSIPYPSGRGGQKQGFTSLKGLDICDCKGLTNLPIEMLESCALSLQTVSLNGLSRLTNLSEVIRCVNKMTRLTSLGIEGVPKFSICSSIQMFSSLKRLEMSPSDSSWNNVSFNETFDAMFLQPSHLIALRRLTLSGMGHWDCLPDQLQNLNSLSHLWLSDFGIEALPEWFGNLSSLASLIIKNCKKLRYLPSKHAMQRLSKLARLYIDRCPLLLKEKRSNPQIVDNEWPKISHIPTIYVNGHKKYVSVSFSVSAYIPIVHHL